MNKTFLIVGLGNIGKEYDNTPHNLGFFILDQYLKHSAHNLFENNFQDFSNEKKLNCLLATIKKENQKIFLAKPTTFMNLSGKAVKEIMAYYNLKPPELLVIHDDLDLPFGKIRFSKNSGPAGHNGIKSIIEELGTQDFSRLRIGINLEENKNLTKAVLRKFSQEEIEIIKKETKHIIESIDSFIHQGLEKTATSYN